MNSIVIIIVFITLTHQVKTSTTTNLCPGAPMCQCILIHRLLSVSCDVSLITANIASLPDSISFLDISCLTENIQRITPETFKKFDKLTSLSFIGCKFKIPKGEIFPNPILSRLQINRCDLQNGTLTLKTPSLISLEISGSGMTSFPEVYHLPNLQYLNVSHNSLKDYGLFESSCGNDSGKSLRHLDLSANYFKHLPKLTTCFPQLSSLRISNNPPLQISDKYFANFTSFEILDLADTSLIGNISNLEKFTNLTILKFQGTHQMLNIQLDNYIYINELHLKNFSTKSDFLNNLNNLIHLKSLKLVSCQITQIATKIFQNMTDLDVLDLSQNEIDYMPPKFFDNLENLRQLNLSYNRIKGIYSGTFTLHSLQLLDLSVNKIVFISSNSFQNLSNILRLNISSNRISKLPEDIFKDLMALEDLFLNNNELNSLPKFSNLKNLKYLVLKDNKLHVLPENTFLGLKSLVGITLRNNSIPHLSPLLFQHCPLITHLDVAYNVIERIEKHPQMPTPWGNLTHLYYLRLDNNKIRYFKDELSTFKALLFLFMDHNKLTIITPKMFPKSLLSLGLSFNHISFIGLILRYLPNLNDLNLQYNYPYLRKLYSSSFWVSSAKKPDVYLAANEFNCDCRLQWLKSLTGPGKEIVKPLRALAIFPDVNFTYCKNSGPGLIKLIDYPMDNFVCVYEKDQLQCLLFCSCCLQADFQECPCAYGCPEDCTCKKAMYIFHANKIICQNRNKTEVPPSLPPDVTDIDLSGNYIEVLDNASFSNLPLLKHLYLNSSEITELNCGSFLPGIPRLILLHLDDNKLREIYHCLFTNLGSLEQLYLHNNHIFYIEANSFSALDKLKILTLHGNRLFDMVSLTSVQNAPNSHVTLSDNMWSCDCSFMHDFTIFVITNAGRISDVDAMFCSLSENNILDQNSTTNSRIMLDDNRPDSIKILDFNYPDICSNKTIIVNVTIIRQVLVNDSRFVGTIIGLSILFGTLITLGILIVWKRRFVQVVLYDKFGVRFVPIQNVKEEHEYKYDAFVSYSGKDEDFVLRELMPKLENEKKLKLCLHFRDFPVGDSLADCIVNAVDSSMKTIVIISNNFLTSEWCKFEFQSAHHVMLTKHIDSLVVILKEKVKNELIDPDLRALMQSRTYVEYGDPWFWEKLYFVLPSIKTDNTDNMKQNDQIEFKRI